MDYAVDRDGVIVIKSVLLLIFSLVHYFEIIRSKIVAGIVESAVNKLDGSGVVVLGKKTDSLLSSLNLI
jgi:hypothetical protein